jgi:RimK family alpha-L-glutamate ligase
MGQGLFVYNIIFEKDPKWIPQLQLFLEAFKKLHQKVVAVNNFKALDVVIRNKKNLDFVFFYDKDVALAELIEAQGVPTFNSARAIRICDDKALTYAKFVEKKISTPKTMVLPFIFGRDISTMVNDILTKLYENGFNFPLVVKERKGSFGDQVYLALDSASFYNILARCANKELLVQEYIQDSKGVDYRLIVAGDKVIAAVRRENQNDFRSNVNQGGKMVPVNNLSYYVKKLAVEAAKACKCEYAGVDIVVDKKENYYVLEVNSNARTYVMEQVTNQDITIDIIKHCLKRIKYCRTVELKYKEYL